MKNNIKKSISGLLIMLSGLSTYGQVYDVVINGRMPSINTSLEYTGACRVWGGMDFELDVYRGDPQPFFYDFEVVSGFSDITLEISYQPWPIGTTCQFSQTRTFSEEEAVGTSHGAQVSAYCSSGSLYADFYPRIAIQRTGLNAGSTEICAGDVLQLTTTEGGFLDFIYNWQYRDPADNRWYDIPSSETGDRDTSFTIEELLGDDHMDYLGQYIRFRLGNSSRSFGTSYVVTYSACGPLVDNIDYSPPACSGDPVNVAVNFNEPLAGSLADGIQNGDERISTIYIVDALDSSLFFAQANQVNMDVNGGTTFTFNNVSDLENGTYNIRYQVEKRINGNWQLRGFIESPPGESFTYVNPPPLVFNSTPVWGAAECFGESSGSLILHVSGGTGSYRYQIDGTGPWTTFTPHASNPVTQTLSPGSHTVRVRDNNNCEISHTGTVGQPAEIDFSSSPDNPSTTYHGGNDAYINISDVREGSGGYSFSWTKQGGAPDFPKTTQSLVEISAGTYTLTITDSNGCFVTRDFTVTEPPPITISLDTITNVLCKGGNNGTINVDVEGGIPGYTYEWFKENELTGIFETTSITTSNITASAGTYHLRVTDNGGSGHTVTSENYTINEPEDFQFSTDITNVQCKGESTGAIDLSITGGTPPYTVSWERDGSVYSTDQDLSGLGAGVYTLTLTALGGCTPINDGLDFVIEIEEPEGSVEIEKLTHINNNIYGGSIGELEIEASGGTDGYAYSWTRNGSPFTLPTGSTDTHLINLPAGDYEVGVTHAGCTVRLSATITEPDLLEITSAIPTHVNCFGESTGSIALTVAGGIPPYKYHWSKLEDDGFSAPDTNAITGLSQGTYEVTVTDTDSPAITSTIVVINQQPQVQITHTQQDNICYNDNQGSIDLTVTGGVPPYSYLWSNGETTQDISGLQTGPYTVVVTDDLGCTGTYEVNIGQPADAVGLIFDVTEITAYQYNNGAIDITITGGEPPYVYEWFADNGFTSADEDISGLAPGDYTLIVYDANYQTSGSTACTIMEEFEIREPGELLVNISEEYSLFCYGDQNGELLANVTGGVTPYSYQWYRVTNGTASDQNIQSPFITDIGEGTYRVTITDANGIEVTSEDHDLSHPEELVLQTLSTTHVLCYGAATGAIDMQVSGGVLPYTVTWNDGATTLDRENLTANSYTITVEDANGCSKQTTVEIIHPYQELRIDNIDVIDVTRFDGSDGSLSVAFSGGASPHNITWTRESTQTTQGNTATITNLMAGDYTVVITDANGCSVSQTYSVTEPDIVEATLINPTCAGFCDASLSLAILERPGNYTYTWNTGSTSSTLTGLCAGTYTVLIGGFGDRILERTYEILDPAPLVVDLGEDRVLCQGQIHNINATISDVGAQYEWTSDTGFSSASPQVDLTQPGTYSLTVTNSLGCIGTDAITISRTTAVIGAEFAVSSQVFTGESVVLVDLSNPTPDVLEWVLPEEAEIVTSEAGYAEVVFNQAGEYVLGMYTELGECQAYQEKRVVVIEREKFEEEEDDISENDRNSFIENYVIYPNPSQGAFTLEIGLSEEKSVSVRIFGLVSNTMVDYRTLQNRKEYLVEYDLRHVSAGVYFIVLETPVSTQVKKLIIE